VPILGLYGGNDDGIPVATVEQMRKALKAGAILHCPYPDTPHVFADYRPSYRKNKQKTVETPTGLVQAAWG